MRIKTSYELSLKELKKFSPSILELGSPIVDSRLEKFEIQIKYKLPDDLKYFLKEHNSISLMGETIYGISDEFQGRSLDKVYNIEHNEVNNPMPKELLPFSPDGRGNHYCINLGQLKNGIAPILFWQHDFEFNSIDEIEETHNCFSDWVNEVLIEWTLEDYNYDGTEK